MCNVVRFNLPALSLNSHDRTDTTFVNSFVLSLGLVIALVFLYKSLQEATYFGGPLSQPTRSQVSSPASASRVLLACRAVQFGNGQ